MGVAVSLEWIAVSTHPHLTQEGFLDVIYVGIVHPSGGNQRNRMWVQNSGADDYIRKVDRLSRQLGPPPSLSPRAYRLSLSSPVSCIRRSRLLVPTHSIPLSLSRLKPCSSSIQSVIRSPPPFSPQAKKLTSVLQFDVNTPHVVYACLGGFVVLVRSPISFHNHAFSSSALVWHVLLLHPREGERHPFSWIQSRA